MIILFTITMRLYFHTVKTLTTDWCSTISKMQLFAAGVFNTNYPPCDEGQGLGAQPTAKTE